MGVALRVPNDLRSEQLGNIRQISTLARIIN